MEVERYYQERDMQDREYERMSRVWSYPYDHGGEDELVNDSIANANEIEASESRNYRIHDDNKYRYQKGKSDNFLGVNLYEKKKAVITPS